MIKLFNLCVLSTIALLAIGCADLDRTVKSLERTIKSNVPEQSRTSTLGKEILGESGDTWSGTYERLVYEKYCEKRGTVSALVNSGGIKFSLSGSRYSREIITAKFDGGYFSGWSTKGWLKGKLRVTGRIVKGKLTGKFIESWGGRHFCKSTFTVVNETLEARRKKIEEKKQRLEHQNTVAKIRAEIQNDNLHANSSNSASYAQKTKQISVSNSPIPSSTIDPTTLEDADICTFSILFNGQKHIWHKASKYRKHVIEAGRRGLTPESCIVLMGSTVKTLTASSPSKPSPALIQDVQEKLILLGYDPGPADGMMGNRTKDAIKYFKQKNGANWGSEFIDEQLMTALDYSLDENRTDTSNKDVATAPKPKVTPTKTSDTTPPSIEIAANIIVKSDSPTVQGRVSDNNGIARVTVNGANIDLLNGKFTFTRYVPASGTTVTIEAIDEWGNHSIKTVKLTRTITDTSDEITFASLDPTKIKGQPNRNAVALIIGVADYTRAPAAVYADSDASVFGDYARRALGIPRSNIKVLTNSSASNTDIKVNLKQWLRGRIEKGKTDVYVFYAGHGLASADGEDLYLLPYDGVPNLLEDTSLQRNELFDVIAAANPKSATVFLDTCYSGLSRGEETLLASARPILISPKQQSTPKGFTVFSAASGQQISSGLDEAKHGLFSYYLMKGLEGPADGNGDRAITADELHAYVLKNVKRQAVRLGREQEPELQGDAERVLVRW